MREAIISSNASAGPDTITMAAGEYLLSINGRGEDAAATGDLDITDDLVIAGAGALDTILDGNYQDRVFHVLGEDVVVEIDGVTIQHGDADGWHGGGLMNNAATIGITNCIITENRAIYAFEDGAGIENYRGTISISDSTISNNVAEDDGGGIENDWHLGQRGIMTISNSSIFGNSASCGGGIDNDDSMTIINTTISDNTAGGCLKGEVLIGGGGGIRHNEDTDPGRSVLTILNSTIVRNHSDYGGGIANDTDNNALVTLLNTIVAENTADLGGPDCMGIITSSGHNLIGTVTGCSYIAGAGDDIGGDAALGDFAEPWEPGTGHYPLQRESAAIDAGDNSGCPADDQLGMQRPLDGDRNGSAVCDIGAIEFEFVALPGLSPPGLVGLVALLLGSCVVTLRGRRGFRS